MIWIWFSDAHFRAAARYREVQARTTRVGSATPRMNHQHHVTNPGRVPIGIWPCDPTPAEHDQLPELVERLTPELLRRVLAEFAQPEDTVAFAGISPAALHEVRDFDIAALPVDGPARPPPHPDRDGPTIAPTTAPRAPAPRAPGSPRPSG